MTTRLGSVLRSGSVLGAVAALSIMGIATGSIPNSNGTITGCSAAVDAPTPVRVIDPATGARCSGDDEFTVTWNVAGPNGQNGQNGVRGPIGPAGAAGPTGPLGIKGPKGAKGPTGAAGHDGPKGSKGATGDQGSPGAPGPTGPKGDKGPVGDTGSAGANAPIAFQNIAGTAAASYPGDNVTRFVGTPVTVTLSGTHRVQVSVSGVLGVAAGGVHSTLEYGICVTNPGANPTGVGESAGIISLDPGATTVAASTAAFGVATGAHNIGLCIRPTAGAFNSNGRVTGLVTVYEAP